MGSGNCAFWAPATFDLGDDNIAYRARSRGRPGGEDRPGRARAAPPRRSSRGRRELSRAARDQRGAPRPPRRRPAVGGGALPARRCPGRCSTCRRGASRRSGTSWRAWAGSGLHLAEEHGGEGYGLPSWPSCSRSWVGRWRPGRSCRPSSRVGADPAGGATTPSGRPCCRAWRRASTRRGRRSRVDRSSARGRRRPRARRHAAPGARRRPGRRARRAGRGRRRRGVVRRRPGRGRGRPRCRASTPPAGGRGRRVAESPPALDRQLPSLERQRVTDLAAVLLVGRVRWAGPTGASTPPPSYAKVREQFGRPIGQFQGVKHRCADMLCALEQARAAAWDAVPRRRRRPRLELAPRWPAPSARGVRPLRQGLRPGARRHRLHLGARRPPVPEAGDWRVRQLLGGPSTVAAAGWRRSPPAGARRHARRRPARRRPTPHRAERPRRSSTTCRQRDKADVEPAASPTPATSRPTGPRRGVGTPAPVEQLVIDEEFRAAHGSARPHLQVGAWVLPDAHRPRHRRSSRSGGSGRRCAARSPGARCSASRAPAPTWRRSPPRRPATDGGLAAHRPEGVDDDGRTSPTGASAWPAPTRRRPSTTASPASCVDMRVRGHRRPAAARAHRPRDVQRGLPVRRVRARRLRRRRRRRRLAGGPHHARQRAGVDGQRVVLRPGRRGAPADRWRPTAPTPSLDDRSGGLRRRGPVARRPRPAH